MVRGSLLYKHATFNQLKIMTDMNPIVSIIMGSTSDLPVMEKAAQLLNDMHVPFEMNALSAHRTPEAVEEFAKNARKRGIKVIIAAAGMAAALPGVIAANTTLPVVGIPMKGGAMDGLDALLATVQMPSGFPVATVALNGAKNAAYLAVAILAVADDELAAKLDSFRLSEPMMIATFFIRFETSLTKQTAQCSASGYTALWCRRKKGMMVQNTREEANTLHCVCHGRSPFNKSKMCPVLVV